MSKSLHYDDDTSVFDYDYAEAYISDDDDQCDDEQCNSSVIVALHGHYYNNPLLGASASSSLYHHHRSNSSSCRGGSSGISGDLGSTASRLTTSSPSCHHHVRAQAVDTCRRSHEPYAAMVLLPEHRHLWEADFEDIPLVPEEEAEEDYFHPYNEEEDAYYYPSQQVGEHDEYYEQQQSPIDDAYDVDHLPPAEPVSRLMFEAPSMCCYFKQTGHCKMGNQCWHGHVGKAHTPCHYGTNCRILEHRAIAKVATAANSHHLPASYIASSSSPPSNQASVGPHAGSSNHSSSPYMSSPPLQYPGGWKSNSVGTYSRHDYMYDQQQQQAVPPPCAPAPTVRPPQQQQQLVAVDFPCAFCDKSGKVMTQEIPVYEGNKVSKAIRVLCGNCLRTYQL